MKIDGSTVLITGASAGLGRALALRLAGEGAKLALVARGETALEKVANEVRALGGEAWVFPFDISDKHAIHPLAAQVAQVVGPVDVLINNASTLGPTPLRILQDTECEDLSQVFETNLVGPFRLTRVIAGSMLAREQGLVLSISSDAAVEPYPTWGAYSASKAAWDHLARVWAAELSGTGVKFVQVDPGEMDTQMHAAAIPDADRSTLVSPEEVAHRLARLILRSDPIESGSRVLAREFL